MLTDKQKQQLHIIAKDSIRHGLQTGEALTIELNNYDEALQKKRATFITLHKDNQLRGCIGILEPLRPLAEDVSHNAFSAAFSDRRFPPVTTDEFDALAIHISILSTPVKMTFISEDDLVSQLRPGIDGLILEEEHHRGTFLPSVWKSIDNKQEFLNHLKQKSGLADNYWSDNVNVYRYTVEDF